MCSISKNGYLVAYFLQWDRRHSRMGAVFGTVTLLSAREPATPMNGICCCDVHCQKRRRITGMRAALPPAQVMYAKATQCCGGGSGYCKARGSAGWRWRRRLVITAKLGTILQSQVKLKFINSSLPLLVGAIQFHRCRSLRPPQAAVAREVFAVAREAIDVEELLAPCI